MRHPLFTALTLALLAAAPALAQNVNLPPDADLKSMAEEMKKAGNLQAAADLYGRLTQEENASVDAHLELSFILRKLGQFEKEVAILNDARKRQPDNPKVLSRLGQALIALGKTQDAVAVYDLLIAIDPKNPLSYSGKAVAFDNAGNHVAAQEIYQQAFKVDPDSASTRSNYGMSLILSGKYDEAIALLEPIADDKIAGPTARQNLALAYGLKGDDARAKEINLRDLTPEQAEENARFYAHYRKMTDKAPPAALSGTGENAPPEAPVVQEEAPAAAPAPAATNLSDSPPPAAAYDSGIFGEDTKFDFPRAKRR